MKDFYITYTIRESNERLAVRFNNDQILVAQDLFFDICRRYNFLKNPRWNISGRIKKSIKVINWIEYYKSVGLINNNKT